MLSEQHRVPEKLATPTLWEYAQTYMRDTGNLARIVRKSGTWSFAHRPLAMMWRSDVPSGLVTLVLDVKHRIMTPEGLPRFSGLDHYTDRLWWVGLPNGTWGVAPYDSGDWRSFHFQGDITRELLLEFNAIRTEFPALWETAREWWEQEQVAASTVSAAENKFGNRIEQLIALLQTHKHGLDCSEFDLELMRPIADAIEAYQVGQANYLTELFAAEGYTVRYPR